MPVCGGFKLPSFCTDGSPYVDVNPYWYKFTCYTAGKLGLLITPKTATDDYDWQLFDITGRDPIDVYKDTSLVVCHNWSGLAGPTGTSLTATGLFHCFGTAAPNFSVMPDLQQGHEYLLMISHFSGSDQSGYALSFPTSGPNAGTASIINPVAPAILRVAGVCDGTQVLVKLSRRISCSTIAADGSDFSITNGRIPVKAIGKGCNTGFDTDSILLTVNQILSPGNYTITAQTGTDGNTLADNCAIALPPGASASMAFTPAAPTPMDSIGAVNCITDQLQLVFSKPIACSSIEPNGTDFLLTGPGNVNYTVRSATGLCIDGVSIYVKLKLDKPIRENGRFTLALRPGSDGNGLIDECGLAVPAGSTISFTTKDIVNAIVQADVSAGCRSDTLLLSHDGNGAANNWEWSIDRSVYSAQQKPAAFVSKIFGDHLVQLKVGNGVCTDTVSLTVNFADNTVKAAFLVNDSLCPPEQLQFTNTSSSNAISWSWNFGNGKTSSDKNPAPQTYVSPSRNAQVNTSLTVQNSAGCADTIYRTVTILAGCHIAVPAAFTPNGDGLNDHFHPLNAFNASGILFRVYNRFGQVIFEATDAVKKWDGRYQGIPQPAGTYVWTFNYTDRDSGEKVTLKGTVVLIR